MPIISAVSWSSGPASAPVIPKTFHNPGTAFTSAVKGSSYFDGTDDYLKVANNTSFRLGTGDFTIECWVNFSFTSLESGSNRRIFVLDDGGNAVDNLQILVDNGGYNTAGDLLLYSNTYLGNLGTDIRFGWHHIAVVRYLNSLKFYLDGVEKSSVSNTQDYSPGGASGPIPMIGTRGDDKGDYYGYISNLRMVVGTAVYTSGFTVPTAPLTDMTYTQLLTCQNNTGAITDASSNSHVITAFGNVQADTSNPFSTLPYSVLDTNSYGVTPPYFVFNSDGSTVYFSRSNFISYATLSTNYDLQTINSTYTDFSVGNTDSNYQGISNIDIVRGIQFASTSGNSSNNGKRMHVLETFTNTSKATGFKVYGLSNGFDPTSMASSPVGSYDLKTLFQNTFSTSVANTLNIGSIHYNANGTKMLIFCRGNKALYELGPFDAYDYHGSNTTQQESLSSTSYSLKMEDNGISINSSYSSPFYIAFNEDGTHLWVSDSRTANPAKLYRFDLSTGFDLSTLSYSGNAIEVSNANYGGTYARGIYEWTAGSRLFYGGGSNSIYTLST